MNIANLYQKLQYKKVSKANFLMEARKTLPNFLTPLMSFEDTIKVLKNKNIISECDCNTIPGGVGDKLSPGDVDSYELKLGVENEMEHTYDWEKAQEIALDHLAEDPHYYTKLQKTGLEYKPSSDTSVDENFGDEQKTDFPDVVEYINKIKKLGWISTDSLFNELPDDMPQAEKAQIMYKLSDLGLLYDSSEIDDEDPLMDRPDDLALVNHQDVDKLLNNTSGVDSILNKTSTNFGLNESKINKDNLSKYPEFANIDTVNPGEYRHGLKCEIENGKNIEAAKKIVLKNLAKDPIFYTNQKAGIKKSKKVRTDIYTLATDKNLVDIKNGMQKASNEKIKDSAYKSKKEGAIPAKKVQEMTTKPKRAKGIKRVMEIPGKEKKIKLKEALEANNIDRSLRAFLKHYKLEGDYDIQPINEDRCILKYYYWQPISDKILNLLDEYFDVEEEVEDDEQTGEVYSYIISFKADKNLKEQFKKHIKKIIYEILDDASAELNNSNPIDYEAKKFIENFVRSIKASGGCTIDFAWNHLSQYSHLTHDQSLKVMYKLGSLGLLYNEDRYKVTSPKDIDNEMHTYMHISHTDDKAELNEDGNNFYKKGSSFTINGNIGNFKRGDKVTVKDIKETKTDIELYLENQDGVKDTLFLDPNDK